MSVSTLMGVVIFAAVYITIGYVYHDAFEFETYSDNLVYPDMEILSNTLTLATVSMLGTIVSLISPTAGDSTRLSSLLEKGCRPQFPRTVN